MAKKYVYLFEEGRAGMQDLLGGKGANLAEMSNIGLPVPPGMIITTEACNEYYQMGKQIPAGLMAEVVSALRSIEDRTGNKFGNPVNPLLVSVRSGAKFSMPGMMDTILNLGLNDITVQGIIAGTQNERFALDCYRRFIQMFSDVVMEVKHHKFETILEKYKEKQGVHFDHELSPESLRAIVEECKKTVQLTAGKSFPQDPMVQLEDAIRAVFRSWHNDRAIVYRKLNDIPHNIGTAVNVQSMVFGNMGPDSGTGVAFSRNPSTGEKALYGEYLMNAQGEDVVAGIRTPLSISTLNEENPAIYDQLVNICNLLEGHYRDMQDIEFTIERGNLYILQTRNGKRTATAAIRIAIELYNEGLITKEEALTRIEPGQLDQLLHRRIDPAAKIEVIAKGLPASPGAASGKVVFDADMAEKMNLAGEKVILVRTETTPDDIHGIVASQGILTSRGGMTSHAAVVARHMGKPCVCGCEALKIDYPKEQVTVEKLTIKQGDFISINGATGQIILGEVPMIDPELSVEFRKLLEWADEHRTLGIMANADNPSDAKKARDFGAQGIGLVRTEHMFMDSKRIPIVQEMILADTVQEREAALTKLLPMQQNDFYGILQAMAGLPVIIRLLDPPLHEFLPNAEELLVEITKLELTGGDPAVISAKETLLRKVRALSEFNPMLGHRGSRLAITYPEIYAMQCRAIFQAAAQAVKDGLEIHPEVMMPLIINDSELALLRKRSEEIAEVVMQEQNVSFEYKIGACIEVPRACLTADAIGFLSDFFSFGTNDLTQTTLGFSRDDAEGKFLPAYFENGVLKNNPFVVLDRDGVGKLIDTAVRLGRSANPELELGICGEQGGEPNSIEFCHLVGMNYVSCSPYRIPIARLAAAQAAIKNR